MARVLFNLPSQHAGRPSGVANFAFQLLDNLIGKSGFDYVLRSPWTREQLPESLRNKTFDIVTVPRPSFLLLDVFRQALLFRYVCRRLDIDLVVNLDPYGASAGGLARAMIVHDLYFRTLPQRVRRSSLLTSDLIFRIMLLGNSEIITVSNSTKRDLEAWYPQSRGRVTTIYSATSLHPAPSDHSPDEITGRYVLAVGNATLNKNFGLLAEAMASVHEALSDVTLVYVGSDPEHTVTTTLNNLGSSLRLVHLSGIDEARLSRLYRGASCLCVPSLYEGFCFPILEAQVSGCPVLCSDRPAMPEIAGEGALIFDPTDAKALADSILNVLQDPAMSNALVQRGYNNASRFSWDAAAREYESVLCRLLEKATAKSIGQVRKSRLA
jgi:glycosyltransferase involved in cell wall biosynthesis